VIFAPYIPLVINVSEPAQHRISKAAYLLLQQHGLPAERVLRKDNSREDNTIEVYRTPIWVSRLFKVWCRDSTKFWQGDGTTIKPKYRRFMRRLQSDAELRDALIAAAEAGCADEFCDQQV
jgi:transposase InsO family protein